MILYFFYKNVVCSSREYIPFPLSPFNPACLQNEKEVPYTKLTSLIDVLGAAKNTPAVLTEIIWNVLCFSCWQPIARLVHPLVCSISCAFKFN